MTTTVTRKMSLPVRITLIVLAVALALFAGLTATNLTAMHTFNAATDSLNADIAAAQDDTTDLNTLKAKQQQVDAQFAEAKALNPVLLPQLRNAINTNSEISEELTKILLERSEQQNSSSSSSSSNSSDNNSDSNSQSSLDGLSDEQKQQVQDLLKSNQTNTSDSDSDSDSSDTQNQNTSGNTSKPW